MKKWRQSKNNNQLWMWLVMEVKSDAINNDTSILTSSYFNSFKIAVSNASFFFKKKIAYMYMWFLKKLTRCVNMCPQLNSEST